MYDIYSIRRANPIAEVAANFGVNLRRLGQRLVGCCPFHRDERPSLVVYPQSDSYFCFGCEAGGDVIDFVGRLKDVGFKEAASMLAGTSAACRRAEPARILNFRLRLPNRGLTAGEAAVIDAAASFYHDAIWSSPDALVYLAERGVERETIRRWRLGFGCGDLARHLRRRRFSLDAARRVGLLAGERDTMFNRIIVPDLDGGGRATWLTGRDFRDRDPRYLNLTVAKSTLGLAQVPGGDVLVTEGPFDWLTAIQWSLPAVALLGTHVSRSAEQSLARFSRVFLALDSDDAGRRATERLMSALGRRTIRVDLPPGVHDLNDLGRSGNGKAMFERCLTSAIHEKETPWTKLTSERVLHAA